VKAYYLAFTYFQNPSAIGQLSDIPEALLGASPIWIAPFVYQNLNTKQYWIPLWVPAKLQQARFH